MLAKNIKLFSWFRVLFVTRFYYPVYTILFLDFGLTLEEFSYLNTVWALVIVLMEVPSGALSDTIGHKKLLVATSILMVCELVTLIILPVGRTVWLLPLMLLNRVLSGLAEAAASGADEAIAYESLKELGREDEWSDVLAKTSRMTSTFMFFAMISGGILYDQKIMGQFIGVSEWIMKLPLLVNLVTAMACVCVAFQFKETKVKQAARWSESFYKSYQTIKSTALWILKSPQILMVIILSLSFDHIVRLYLTLGVEYYRMIQIPTSLLGVVGSSISFIGIFMPFISKSLVKRFSYRKNMLMISAMLFSGFLFLAQVIPYWGILASLTIAACMFMNGYFTSYYLNSRAPEDRRATVLSFKGVVVSIAYGAVTYGFAVYIKQFETTLSKDEVFIEGLRVFPWYFLASFIIAFSATKVLSRRVK